MSGVKAAKEQGKVEAVDVHAIIYSEDVPTLENKLHKLFEGRRVNLINNRKEFFRVTIDEIAQAVKENHGEIDITLAAEAVEYRKSLAMLQDRQQAPPVEAWPQPTAVESQGIFLH